MEIDLQPAITASGLTVGLEDYLQAPSTRPDSYGWDREAFINTMFHADDGTDASYLIDSRGIMYVIEDGVLDPEPFLDMRDAEPGFLFNLNEHGLRSFAFHPDFENQGSAGYGKLYTAATTEVLGNVQAVELPDGVPSTMHNVLTEWQVDPSDSSRVDTGSRREVLRWEEAGGDHTIQQLLFDPTLQPGQQGYGHLYVSSGDGGYGADGYRLSQDGSSLEGKVLLIDPLQQQDGSAYGIPRGNPYVGDPEFRDEIWAYGLRNPQNMSVDPVTGKLIITDIGHDNVEEINLGQAGANYGWREREGTFVIGDDPSVVQPLPADDDPAFVYPVAQYDHGEGFAITGGFTYRGEAIPELQGQYLFGDIANGRVFHLPVDELQQGSLANIQELTLVHEGREQSMEEILQGRVDLRFGLDGEGEIYLLSKVDGMVRKLVPDDDPEPTPEVGNEWNIVTGTDGNDVLQGTDEQDEITARAGNDRVTGGAGDDIVMGGADADTINGGEGDDLIDGGPGRDIVMGGEGGDIFVLAHADNLDFIQDFELGVDRLRVTHEALVDADGMVDLSRLHADKLATSMTLRGDVNGDGVAERFLAYLQDAFEPGPRMDSDQLLAQVIDNIPTA